MRYSFVVLMIATLSFSIAAAATENEELIDALQELEQEQQLEQLTTLQQDFEFETFSSCEDMNTVLQNFLEENEEMFSRWGGRYGGRGGMVDDVAVMREEKAIVAQDWASVPTAAPMAANAESDSSASTSIDVSTTNIQVAGVDEPDILKTDGDYLYYYNARLQKVFILSSPLNRQTKVITMNDLQIVSTIAIPETFRGVQLFIENDTLVIVGQRRRETANYDTVLDTSQKTDVIMYDVTDKEDPQLNRFSDLDGMYHDARLIGDKLYVVSQVQVNRRGPVWRYYDEDKPMPIDDFLPKALDVAYTTNTQSQNLTIWNTTYPYRLSVQKPDCDDVFYVLPTQESLENIGTMPSFSVVRVFDLDASDSLLTTTASFGTTSTIHMSQDGLYLVGALYTSAPFKCAAGRACILPWYPQGQNSLIHKFSVESEGGLDYVASTIVSGTPLTQYSMDEDADGNFRLLTSTREQTSATHVFVLDDALKLEGMLLNIEPGEQFKASRYIGDKLYLVTFEQIDPLFVIDMEDTSKPQIIGELKIPGFSTYLHPYAPAENDVQYLLGLGYDTANNQRGGTSLAGIKVDLYKVDYSKKDSNGMIAVTQEATKTLWSGGSYTEAVDNPRMVVWDSKRNLLVLPIILQSEEKGQSCSIEYDAQGKEIGRYCYDNTRYKTTFAGMKGFTITPTNGIKESFSYDYSDALKQDTQTYGEEWPRGGEIYSRQFQNLQFRVGYLWDVLYALNNLFGHFVIPTDDDESAYVTFDEEVEIE